MFRYLDEYTKKLIDTKLLNRCKSVELVVNEKCQNACTYCYRKFKHKESSVTSLEPESVRILMERFFELIKEDGREFLKHRAIELFGGDALLDYRHSREILKIVDSYNPQMISIPTNARLVSELTDYDLESLFKDINTRVGLSLSVDGCPSDNNRPLSKTGKMLAYEEKINYDRLFKIARKYGYGYHPMLSFKRIDKWFETIKFFFENFGIVPYLLEVRHSLSKEDAVKAVIQLVKIRDFYESVHERAVEMANTIKASRVPRGLGCSSLTCIYIMPNGDIPFCHRVVDPPWVYGNVNYGIDVTKAVSLTSVYDHRNVPECFICPIREICSGLCQGACYEYWGDPWIPIPSVCNYFRLKSYIFSLKYDDWKRMTEKTIDRLHKSIMKEFGENTVEYIRKEGTT